MFDATVWIKINSERIQDKLILGKKLLKRWKDENAYTHNIMPIIECAHLWNLDVDNFIKILQYESSIKNFKIIM